MLRFVLYQLASLRNVWLEVLIGYILTMYGFEVFTGYILTMRGLKYSSITFLTHTHTPVGRFLLFLKMCSPKMCPCGQTFRSIIFLPPRSCPAGRLFFYNLLASSKNKNKTKLRVYFLANLIILSPGKPPSGRLSGFLFFRPTNLLRADFLQMFMICSPQQLPCGQAFCQALYFVRPYGQT